MSHNGHHKSSSVSSSISASSAPSSSTQNGQRNTNSNNSYADNNTVSVADIKHKAKEGVNKEARGVSAITLIKTARSQLLFAKEYEAKGDLRAALGSYIKAATLTKMAMDSSEYAQESKGKGGVIRKELNDLLSVRIVFWIIELELKIRLCVVIIERCPGYQCPDKCCRGEAESHRKGASCVRTSFFVIFIESRLS